VLSHRTPLGFRGGVSCAALMGLTCVSAKGAGWWCGWRRSLPDGLRPVADHSALRSAARPRMIYPLTAILPCVLYHREVIIEKHWRGNASRALCDVFWAEVVRYGGRTEDVPPVLAASTGPPGAAAIGPNGDRDCSDRDASMSDRPPAEAAAAIAAAAAGALIHLHRHGLYLLAAVGLDTPPLETVSFLEALASVFSAYFGELSEHAIKDHFVTVYELLDEMVDNGRPHTTEVCVLQEMVTPPSVVGRMLEVAAAATGGGVGAGRGGGAGTVSTPGRPPGGGGMGMGMGMGMGGGGLGVGLGGVPSASSVVSAATSAVTSAVSSAAASAAHGTAAFAQQRFASPGHIPGALGGGGGGFGGGTHRSSGNGPPGARGWASSSGAPPPLLLPWRRTGVVHPQNEVFVDIVEEVDAVLLGRRGTPLHALVAGRIDVRAALSGMPHVTMTLSGGEGMDDVAPHRCVQSRSAGGTALGPDGGGVLSFVPPDGEFTLLEYVVRDIEEGLLPLHLDADLTFVPVPDGSGGGGGGGGGGGKLLAGSATGTLSLTLSPRMPPRGRGGFMSGSAPFRQSIASAATGAILEAVTATVHLPPGVNGVTPTPSPGTTAQWDSTTRTLSWTIGSVAAGGVARLGATLTGVPGGRTPVAAGTAVVVDWRLPSTAVTGLHVDSLTITGEIYKPYKGLRCVTKSGRYELRL